MRRVFKVGMLLFGGAVFLMADSPAIQAIGEPVAITAAEDLYMSPVWSPGGHTIATLQWYLPGEFSRR
jgi:hypothetical protein